MNKTYRIFFLLFLTFSAVNVFAQQSANPFDLYEKGEYKQAADILEKNVRADKTDRKSRIYLAMLYFRADNEKKADQVFNEADKLELEKPAKDETALQMTAKPRASFTDSARRNETQGTVKLIGEFNADGTLGSIVVFKGLANGLSENALKVAKEIKFKPATRNGKPVQELKIISYTFTIY